jgi:hypothetical protein
MSLEVVMIAMRWRTMVGQDPANKWVIAKIVFSNGLWVKCEVPAVAGAFFNSI